MPDFDHRGGCDAEGGVALGEGDFEILVQKIDHLTDTVEKIETRFEKREAAQNQELSLRDDRLRAVELELAITKTKVLWIVTGASFIVSTIVSVVASIAVSLLGK